MHSSGGIAHLMATACAHEERFGYWRITCSYLSLLHNPSWSCVHPLPSFVSIDLFCTLNPLNPPKKLKKTFNPSKKNLINLV
jgi:hypothetical protein